MENSRNECVCIDNQGKDPLLQVRQNVNMEQNCHITCCNSIIIGARTAITANVTITDIRHSYEDITTAVKYQPCTTTPVRIGTDCHIANGAVILPGTIIGNHCVVGANAVVQGCFPDFTIIAGNPAKVIKRNIRWKFDSYGFVTNKYKQNSSGDKKIKYMIIKRLKHKFLKFVFRFYF